MATKDKIRRGDFGVGEVFRILSTAYNFQMGRSSFRSSPRPACRRWPAGRRPTSTRESERLFRRKIADLVYRDAGVDPGAPRARSSRRPVQFGDGIQVEPVARWLGIEEVVCNRFVLDDEGCVTGKLVSPVIWGEGKATAAQRYAATHDIDLALLLLLCRRRRRDVALMHMVGNPRPTNPGPELTRSGREARVADHPSPQSQRRRRQRARQDGGLPRGARADRDRRTRDRTPQGDKRSGLNLLTSMWPKLLLRRTASGCT